jgi:NADPH:quinone reductase-like Zn-dependent oxidoreductase
MVAELSEARKKKALDIGADAVIDPREEDVVERVKELTDGEGWSIRSTPPASSDAPDRAARHPQGRDGDDHLHLGGTRPDQPERHRL